MVHSFSDSMGGVLLSIQFSYLVAIAIAVMNWSTEPMADTLYPASFCADVKVTTSSHEHPAHIDTLLAAGGDYSPYQIPGLHPFDALCCFGLGNRETNLVNVTFLSVPITRCANQQRNDPGYVQRLGRTRPYICRVNPVRLWQVPL